MDKIKNTWICQNEKIILSSSIMELVEKQCRSSEDSRTFNFYTLKSNDWCNIIPITKDGKVVFVRQHRVGVDSHTLELPGGVTDPEDKDILQTAIRELEEETGYTVLPEGKCVNLGWNFPNPAILNNRCHSFVIGPVHKSSKQSLDMGEMIEVVEVPIHEIPERIINGEINHALMLNTFFLLALKSKETSSELMKELKRFT